MRDEEVNERKQKKTMKIRKKKEDQKKKRKKMGKKKCWTSLITLLSSRQEVVGPLLLGCCLIGNKQKLKDQEWDLKNAWRLNWNRRTGRRKRKKEAEEKDKKKQMIYNNKKSVGEERIKERRISWRRKGNAWMNYNGKERIEEGWCEREIAWIMGGIK